MMTLEKWLKIEALMKSPASTPNEKAICKKLLADNPKPTKPQPAHRFVHPGVHRPTPRTQESGDFRQQTGDSIRQQQARERRQQATQEQTTEAAKRAQKEFWRQRKQSQRDQFQDRWGFDRRERRPYGRTSEQSDQKFQSWAKAAKAQRQAYVNAENVRRDGAQHKPPGNPDQGLPTLGAQERWDIYRHHMESRDVPIFDPSMFDPPSDQKKKNFIDELARMFKKGKKGKNE